MVFVNLSLFLIYELNFIIGMHVQEKIYSLYVVQHYPQFQAFTRGLEDYFLRTKGEYYIISIVKAYYNICNYFIDYTNLSCFNFDYFE